MQTYSNGPYEGIQYYGGKTKDVPECPVELRDRTSWYIKMGFAGFNSPANNRLGYKSHNAAVSAIRRYQAK